MTETLPVPRTFKVGFQTVNLYPMTPEEVRLKRAIGTYEWENGTIRVSPKLSASQQAQTLLHELLHACFHVYSLKAKGCTEEEMCGALDGPLTALFTDNPKLIEKIQRAVHYEISIFEEVVLQ